MIISDPATNPDRVLIVNFTSWQPLHDSTCLLAGDEHPFLKHATCVNYPAAQLTTVAKLKALHTSGELRLYPDPLSPELLQRIRNGARDSLRIMNEHRQLLESQGLFSSE
jgi:hypothetical protein